MNDDICAICLESLTNNSCLKNDVTLICKHTFHKQCINSITKCPMCGIEIKKPLKAKRKNSFINVIKSQKIFVNGGKIIKLFYYDDTDETANIIRLHTG